MADLEEGRLYELDNEEPEVRSPALNLLARLAQNTKTLQLWRQIHWPVPQQRGTQDCGIGTIAHMVEVVRGSGLPGKEAYSVSQFPTTPSPKPGGNHGQPNYA